MIMNNQKAMTLIETLVATAIFAAVLGGLYTALTVGNKSWNAYNDNLTVQREARNGLFSIVKEIREAQNILITKDSGHVTINFKRPSVGIVSYKWTDSGPEAHKIIRQNNSNSRILANNISALSFDYPRNNAIVVDITATQKPLIGEAVTFHLKEKVALRSKVGLLK